MRVVNVGLVVLIAGSFVAAQSSRPAHGGGVVASASGDFDASSPKLITGRQGAAIVSAAWEHRRELDYKPDCSHLVHDVYQFAGLNYPYAPSSDLYAGLAEFARVKTPQPGDLIVWPGHVGIVVDPKAHSFYSSLRSGLKIDFYDTRAWNRRVPARFYRFVRQASTPAMLLASNNPEVANDSATLPEAADAASLPPAAASGTTAEPDVPAANLPIALAEPGRAAISDALYQTWSNLDLGSRELPSDRELVLVRQLKVQRVQVRKGHGTAQIKVSCYARLAADTMETRCADELISLPLSHSSTGWRLDPSSKRTYLAGDAAAAALSERLATLIREGAPRAEQVQAADLLSALVRNRAP